MSQQDTLTKVAEQETDIQDTSLYRHRKERAEADKPPARSNPLGAVAASRFPDTPSRTDLAANIRSEDDQLVAGTLGTTWYQPKTVCGIDLKLEPLQPSIGTVIHGLDVANDLENPEVVSFLRQLWLRRRVIAFRGQQHLTQKQLYEYASKFGEVGMPFGEKDHVPNSPYDLNQQTKVKKIPNLLLLPSDEDVPNIASGWHADATWQQKPPMASVLMCREAPPVGGDTCFCDCYSMWQGLSKATKERTAHLHAVHIGGVGHQMDGKTPVSVHPVARTHPETGQTTLYVQQGFVKRFADADHIPEDEQRRMLLEMRFQEGRPEYTCRMKWEPGTLAMWDNRCVLHSGSGDYWPHRRYMERLTILDADESRRVPYYSPASSEAN